IGVIAVPRNGSPSAEGPSGYLAGAAEVAVGKEVLVDSAGETRHGSQQKSHAQALVHLVPPWYGSVKTIEITTAVTVLSSARLPVKIKMPSPANSSDREQ